MKRELEAVNPNLEAAISDLINGSGDSTLRLLAAAPGQISAPVAALMLGVPAVVKGWVCECGLQLRFDKGEACCPACGRRYRKLQPDRIEKID